MRAPSSFFGGFVCVFESSSACGGTFRGCCPGNIPRRSSHVLPRTVDAARAGIREAVV